MRRKLEVEILRKNGYDNLTEALKEKFNRFSSAVSGEKICSILKFDEFCNIFSKTTFLFHLRYQNIVYDIDRYDGTYAFFSDGGENVPAFNYIYNSLESFINGAKINGISLCEVWDEILID